MSWLESCVGIELHNNAQPLLASYILHPPSIFYFVSQFIYPFQLSIMTISLLSLWHLIILFLHLPFLSTSSVIPIQSRNTETILPDNRQPALYTKDYGTCQDNSMISMTRFDGAFYQDNMTATWGLNGASSVENETVMRGLNSAPQWNHSDRMQWTSKLMHTEKRGSKWRLIHV